MSAIHVSDHRAGEATPVGPRSRVRRLVRFYTSPGDRTPTWVGVVMGLLAVAGLVVLGPTSQVWLLACAALLAYAVAAIVRPVEAWRILREPAGPPADARPRRHSQAPSPTGRCGPGQTPEGSATPDASGWLPTRRLGRR